MLKKLLSLLFLLPLLVTAQDIDVQHYAFAIRLFDSTDRIEGETYLDIRFPGGNRSFALDLVGKKANGKGMTVQQFNGYNVASWKQEGDRILVELKEGINNQDAYRFQVRYSGIPADGLIISKNKWGDRTFFADNWPNRAHHWIPCNDRPDDKASFEFRVTVPAPYTVISNGAAEQDKDADDPEKWAAGPRHYYYVERTPQPTKVMVIGAARFAVKTFEDSPQGIPVSAWVYPQDSSKGFYDYAVAPSILKFFSSYIAPFPYSKLANVQSKTIFGGMENASAIFYAEESVTGDRKWEDVIAHEIAHQWFGDMASEKSFAHLWLSEGFATYFTNLYIEHKYGTDSMRKRLQDDRRKIIGFVAANPTRAVVDSTQNLMSLLNANSYDKGGWVLHMLRQEVGDTAFQTIIRKYYETYKGSNAETRDLQRIASEVSGKPMDTFFNQWLYRGGIPSLYFSKKVKEGKVLIEVAQKTREPFSFTLEVGLLDNSGKLTLHRIPVSERQTTIKLETGNRSGIKVLVDPNTSLLFQESAEKGNYFRVRKGAGPGSVN
ncbi:M1 family metallopeptidase [Flaviaesturariibacter aridisoli]|uniref:Aminopeptidase N n=1 Tax=Flaviaesturariibacter aridisoli TaxID=2545761 RepID=A0A4R4DXZ4_9BACT|nr:M1 family metallopeptidase [Flaviaesturariibacter aridisoli]TCZ67742.1 M1 family peptidase [Flaviaesturariibacter aridisoli]